ncbi:MAG: hypothetical protein PHS41_04935 [Victivallaceae bacterium]|nr:hypothetical protein [Victivallaceae bacterium]
MNMVSRFRVHQAIFGVLLVAALASFSGAGDRAVLFVGNLFGWTTLSNPGWYLGGILGVLGCLYGSWLCRMLMRRVARPMQTATWLTSELAAGRFPPVANTGNGKAEIFELLRQLNVIRDTMCAGAAKLKKNREQELELRRDAEEKTQVRSLLVLRIMPELRQSLNVLSLYSDYFREKSQGKHPENTECFRVIERNVDQIERQIEKLGDMLRLGEDFNDFTPGSFPTDDFVRQLQQNVASNFVERNLKIKLITSGQTPDALVFDRQKLLQFLSIILRALGRSLKSSDTILMRILTQNDNSGYQFAFGSAAGNAYITKFYREFFSRKEKMALSEDASTSLLRMLYVELESAAFGGKFTLSEDPIAGTELVFSINRPADEETGRPRLRLHNSGPSMVSNANAAEGRPSGGSESVSDSADDGAAAEPQIRLLLFEPDRDNAEVLGLLFELQKIECDTTGSLPELEKMLSSRSYDVVLFSINSRLHRDGELRSELARLPDPGSVLLLGNGFAPMEKEFLATLGYTNLLGRPFTAAKVFKEIRRIRRRNGESLE